MDKVYTSCIQGGVQSSSGHAQLASGHLTTCWQQQLRHFEQPSNHRQRARERRYSGQERETVAPVVRLSAEDIASIALTLADILWRQEKRDPTSGTGGMGSPSTAVRVDPPATQSQSDEEVLKSLGTTV